MRSSFQIQATEVANKFIDEYMSAASGEYVKVYLYILRHHGETLNVDTIADALNHTEADVRRAITYWKKQGVLVEDGGQGASDSGTKHFEVERAEEAEGRGAKRADNKADSRMENRIEAVEHDSEEDYLDEPDADDSFISEDAAAREDILKPRQEETLLQAGSARKHASMAKSEKKTSQVRPIYTTEQVNRVAMEEDFGQLLYIAQKYMNKVFTPRDCELFAYLYDGLHMSMELLEYLVEYCVQGGHSNLRYLETVALNWHEKGIRTVDEAKMYVTSYNKDTFAVMKAFGLGDRNPGSVELDMIQRWFKEYGFTKEIVVEACNRTLAAIHTPSFQYADKILSEWRKAGVKTMREISALDEKRDNRTSSRQPVAPKTGRNQFHNFEQRDTNYDAMVLERLKKRLGEQ